MARITDPDLNKIPPQHKIRPKFMAYLAAYLEKLKDIAEVLRQIDPEHDLDIAIGSQLDTIGGIVGAQRLLDFEPVYAPALLTDDYYRMIIRAKISLNHWDGTTSGIQDSWNVVKNGYQLDVIDTQDMAMLLRVHGVTDLFESEFISRGYLAPKPEGVRVNYEFLLEDEVVNDYYVGGFIGNTAVEFDIPNRWTFGDCEHDEEVFIGGCLCSSFVSFILPSRKM